jgi:hypothetical protein
MEEKAYLLNEKDKRLICPLTTHKETKNAFCRDWAHKEWRCDNCPLKINYKIKDYDNPSYSGMKA